MVAPGGVFGIRTPWGRHEGLPLLKKPTPVSLPPPHSIRTPWGRPLCLPLLKKPTPASCPPLPEGEGGKRGVRATLPPRAGVSLSTIIPHPDAVEQTAFCHPRLPAGLRPAEIILFSVWCGGKAATPNRKLFLRDRRPPLALRVGHATGFTNLSGLFTARPHRHDQATRGLADQAYRLVQPGAAERQSCQHGLPVPGMSGYTRLAADRLPAS